MSEETQWGEDTVELGRGDPALNSSRLSVNGRQREGALLKSTSYWLALFLAAIAGMVVGGIGFDGSAPREVAPAFSVPVGPPAAAETRRPVRGVGRDQPRGTRKLHLGPRNRGAQTRRPARRRRSSAMKGRRPGAASRHETRAPQTGAPSIEAPPVMKPEPPTAPVGPTPPAVEFGM